MNSAALFAAAIAAVAAVVAARRPKLPGRDTFVLLMLAMGFWSALEALSGQTPDAAARVTLSSLQYLAICSLPLLSLLYARQAVGLPAARPRTVALLAMIPLLTVALAWTNRWHGWIWSRITQVGPELVYEHGPWFWAATAYSYLLLLATLLALLRALRRTPPAFRAQIHALLLAVGLPWAANLLYLTGAMPTAGLDLTPITFALTGPLILWGMTRHRLLDLMPAVHETLLDQLDDGVIILDHRRRIVGLNPAALRLTGLRGDAVGEPFGEALPTLAPALAAAGGGACMVEAVGPAAATVELRATPLPRLRGGVGGWLVTLHDITIQQTLARELREGRDFALQVMQTMGEGLTVTDNERRFTFVNDAYARQFGYTPAELIGRTPSDLTVEEDHAALLAARALRREGRSSTYLSHLRRADGRITTVQITGTPRIVDGQVVGSVAVITDLSERLAMEEALRTAEQTLRSFFDSAGAMMGIVELGDDDILHVTDNAATAAFFGTTAEAMRGQWASAMGVPPTTIERWLSAYRGSEQTGRPVSFDYMHEKPEGRFWLAVTVCRIGPASSGRPRCSYVATDITARKALEQELRSSQLGLAAANAQLLALARTDGLTGLLNRAAFDDCLGSEVIRAMRYQTPLSLLMIDIDHFKGYNDAYGHVAGDHALRAVAQLFREQLRQSDLAARYGGEEFAIILPNTDADEAMLAAERIRCCVERTPWPERGITVSIGAATVEPSASVEQLVQQADKALYHAKEQGRNRVAHTRQVTLELSIRANHQGSAHADRTPSA